MARTLWRRAGGLAMLALSFVLLLIAAAAVWVAVTQLTVWNRESRSVEQIAAGRGRWVQTPDARIYLQEWGSAEAPTLLLTHGTGAWSGSWFSLPDTLAKAGWRVVAVDLPPFGLSSTSGAAGSADYSRSAQAKRVLSVIDSLGRPVTLVGHSFGSGPALEAAVLGGNRVQQVVLVDPALGLGALGEPPHCDASASPPAMLNVRPLRTAVVGATATWPGFSAALLRQFVHRKEVVTPELVPAYQIPFERTAFSASLGDWAASFALASCEPAHSLRPDALTAWAAGGPPIRLIWGAEDTITPLAQGRALQRWMPSAELSVLPGVGHIPHIEDPAAFSAALLKALGAPR
jgi:pimeloyl-ACP methyl ester carboxylesterase